MVTATYITKYPRQSSKGTSVRAGLALRLASRIADGLRRIWRAVANFMRALDRRLTENLDLRARYYLHGNADRSDARRHES
jgi:hypothetical protein